MRFVEALIFGAVAVGAHVAVWTISPVSGGATGSGAQGADEMSLTAATAAQSTMVERWQRPPETSQEQMAALPVHNPLAPSLPDMPQMHEPFSPVMPAPAAPDQTFPTAPQLPQIDTASAPPPPTAPPPLRPQLRPASVSDAAAAQQRQPKQVAKGKAQSQAAGTTGNTALQATEKARNNALRAQWGAAIYAKIQRNMRFPRGLRDAGTAKLALRVASNGQLKNLSLARSSGNAAIDHAALKAVSRAGRFSKAPRGLTGDVHSFSLSLTFTR